jgi:serine/threonine protein phosphatase 1
MAVWVTTDLHGNYDLWAQIKEFLQEDDTLIFLGDAVDRGSRGFEIFMELFNDERVCYLRGNHEEMMADAYLLQSEKGEFLKHWYQNGGKATKANIDSLGLDWDTKKALLQKVYQLPLWAQYTNESGDTFILSHAGYTPGDYYDKMTEDQKENYLIWNRNHWNLPWSKDEKYKQTIMVHGHTPILLMKQWGFNASGLSPFWYDNNHKVNVDAATANTGLAFLLNLDTYDYELFTDGSIYKYTEEEE